MKMFSLRQNDFFSLVCHHFAISLSHFRLVAVRREKKTFWHFSILSLKHTKRRISDIFSQQILWLKAKLNCSSTIVKIKSRDKLLVKSTFDWASSLISYNFYHRFAIHPSQDLALTSNFEMSFKFSFQQMISLRCFSFLFSYKFNYVSVLKTLLSHHPRPFHAISTSYPCEASNKRFHR